MAAKRADALLELGDVDGQKAAHRHDINQPGSASPQDAPFGPEHLSS
jgi:hypothetical protein